MTIGENIRRIRQERGLTQRQLGELVGASEAYIRAYESGRRNPKPASLEKIAEALAVNSEVLTNSDFDGIKALHRLFQIFRQYDGHLFEYQDKDGNDMELIDVIEEESVHLEGASRLLELPEFSSLEVAKNFLNILDEKDLMADMLNTGFAKDINVYIGEENEKEQLKDYSIVTFKHRIGNKDLGTIGIIGPKRMDYAKVISVMKYMSKKLNDKEE